MRSAKIGIIFLILMVQHSVTAQQKRPLNHSDYDSWESLSGDKISKNGQWVGFHIDLQDGDGRLELVDYDNPDQRHLIPRGHQWQFSNDSRYSVGKIVAEKDSVRVLKLKKTKAEEMPKDSLFILDLRTGDLEKLARVKSYALPEETGNWLAIYFE